MGNTTIDKADNLVVRTISFHSTQTDGDSSNGNKAAVGDESAAVLPGGPWYKRGHLLKLNFCILSLVLFSSANGYDGSLMNGLQTLHQWNSYMNEPAGAWLGFINAVYWLGCGLTYPVAAWVANKYGRKLGVYIGYAFLILGAGLQTATHKEVEFILARFFVGIAAAWFGNCVPLLINEIAFPTQRGVANALFMCGWYVGGTVAAWITFGTRNMESSWAWRIPSLMQVLLPLLALPGFLMAPQSPRWLVAVDRTEEAHQILTKHHAGGDVDSQLVNFEMIEITTTIKTEQESHDSAGYMEMTKTPGNRKRLFISMTLGIFAQWSGNGVVSYYLALVLDTVGITSVTDQTLISACLQIWNLLWAVAAALSVDKLGRRPLFITSAAVMCVSYVCVTALSGSFASTGHASTGLAVIPFLFFFFAGYDVALTPFLTAYPCEIWPFRLRSHGLTVTWVVNISATLFNTFVNPIAMDSIGWKYYFVFIVMTALFGFTAFFCYPETKGHTLEQMAILFDGDAAEVPPPSATAARSISIAGRKNVAVMSAEGQTCRMEQA